ncbi:TPA: hypothetical protein QH074_004343 [Enterobacter hormaechei subsp. steigerwaltii]|nr:hypothetical protein [Enterobacter hormaechei subsp. steigerwaltii]
MNNYEIEYLRRTIREAAERVIEARAVNIYPHTEEHRTEQLAHLVATLTPEDLIALLKA